MSDALFAVGHPPQAFPGEFPSLHSSIQQSELGAVAPFWANFRAFFVFPSRRGASRFNLHSSGPISLVAVFWPEFSARPRGHAAAAPEHGCQWSTSGLSQKAGLARIFQARACGAVDDDEWGFGGANRKVQIGSEFWTIVLAASAESFRAPAIVAAGPAHTPRGPPTFQVFYGPGYHAFESHIPPLTPSTPILTPRKACLPPPPPLKQKLNFFLSSC